MRDEFDTPTITACCLVPQLIKAAGDVMCDAKRVGRNCFRLLPLGDIRD